jgi:phosphoglycerate dehydrogenase-like enzyme
VFVYDPYLAAPQASELGAEKIDTLDELLTSCRIVARRARTLQRDAA